jgi:hypothetical protein
VGGVVIALHGIRERLSTITSQRDAIRSLQSASRMTILTTRMIENRPHRPDPQSATLFTLSRDGVQLGVVFMYEPGDWRWFTAAAFDAYIDEDDRDDLWPTTSHLTREDAVQGLSRFTQIPLH